MTNVIPANKDEAEKGGKVKKRRIFNHRADRYLFRIDDNVFHAVLFRFVPIYDLFHTVSLVCKRFNRWSVESLKNRKLKHKKKVLFLIRRVPGKVFYDRLYHWKIVDPDMFSQELFLFACKRGYDDLAREIYAEHGSKVRLNEWDNFALRMAARNGHKKVLKFLLDSQVTNPGAKENSAIYLASMRGHTDCVKLLINDSRVNPADCSNSALKEAAFFGFLDIVRILLRDEKVLSTVGTRRAIENARTRHRKYKELKFKEIMITIKNAVKEYQCSIDM